jgi:hypothetical protein
MFITMELLFGVLMVTLAVTDCLSVDKDDVLVVNVQVIFEVKIVLFSKSY